MVLAGGALLAANALTFGVLFFDYDLDGRLDLLTANVHLEDAIQNGQASHQHAQPPHLFWNAATGARSRFVLVDAIGSGGGGSNRKRDSPAHGRAGARVSVPV